MSNDELIDLIKRMIYALISATRAVDGGVKEFDRLIDEGFEAIRITPPVPDAEDVTEDSNE